MIEGATDSRRLWHVNARLAMSGLMSRMGTTLCRLPPSGILGTTPSSFDLQSKTMEDSLPSLQLIEAPTDRTRSSLVNRLYQQMTLAHETISNEWGAENINMESDVARESICGQEEG